ncbi:hypothetical protein DPMN_148313 [Dreissena polymorpha]|uniref:Uncharacterized protein n=1 Tax=Dreissena polymorpha TaxID=45954 RepID=A0A9D4FDS0_DREPO|nr:hypothetical protein DPMN_148313 [Dreissena polymorpha]
MTTLYDLDTIWSFMSTWYGVDQIQPSMTTLYDLDTIWSFMSTWYGVDQIQPSMSTQYDLDTLRSLMFTWTITNILEQHYMVMHIELGTNQSQDRDPDNTYHDEDNQEHPRTHVL